MFSRFLPPKSTLNHLNHFLNQSINQSARARAREDETTPATSNPHTSLFLTMPPGALRIACMTFPAFDPKSTTIDLNAALWGSQKLSEASSFLLKTFFWKNKKLTSMLANKYPVLKKSMMLIKSWKNSRFCWNSVDKKLKTFYAVENYVETLLKLVEICLRFKNTTSRQMPDGTLFYILERKWRRFLINSVLSLDTNHENMWQWFPEKIFILAFSHFP